MNKQTHKNILVIRAYADTKKPYMYYMYLNNEQYIIRLNALPSTTKAFNEYVKRIVPDNSYYGFTTYNQEFYIDDDTAHEMLLHSSVLSEDKYLVEDYFLSQTIHTDPVLKLKEAYRCDGFVINTPENTKHYIFFNNLIDGAYSSDTIKDKIDYAFMHLDLVGSNEYMVLRFGHNMKVINYPYSNFWGFTPQNNRIFSTQNS